MSIFGAVDWSQAAADGLVAGTVVLLGVLAESGLTRLRERRRRIEQAVANVIIDFPHVLEARTRPYDPDQDNEALDLRRERFLVASSEIRLSARWPLRRSKELRIEASRALAAEAGTWMLWEFDRRPVSQTQVVEILSNRWYPLLWGRTGRSVAEASNRWREALRRGETPVNGS